PAPDRMRHRDPPGGRVRHLRRGRPVDEDAEPRGGPGARPGAVSSWPWGAARDYGRTSTIERTGSAGRGTGTTNIEAITLFIEDVQRSKDFSSEVFGADVIHEEEAAVVFKFENPLINLLQVKSAPDLIAPAIVADQAAGARYQFTLAVADVDEV